MDPIDNLFSPTRVAVVGASATKGRPGRVVIENMIASGFAVDIYPVNPRGVPTFPLIEDPFKGSTSWSDATRR